MLAELSRMAAMYESRLIVIHLGKKNIETEHKMTELLSKFSIDNISVIWKKNKLYCAIKLSIQTRFTQLSSLTPIKVKLYGAPVSNVVLVLLEVMFNTTFDVS